MAQFDTAFGDVTLAIGAAVGDRVGHAARMIDEAGVRSRLSIPAMPHMASAARCLHHCNYTPVVLFRHAVVRQDRHRVTIAIAGGREAVRLETKSIRAPRIFAALTASITTCTRSSRPKSLPPRQIRLLRPLSRSTVGSASSLRDAAQWPAVGHNGGHNT